MTNLHLSLLHHTLYIRKSIYKQWYNPIPSSSLSLGVHIIICINKYRCSWIVKQAYVIAIARNRRTTEIVSQDLIICILAEIVGVWDFYLVHQNELISHLWEILWLLYSVKSCILRKNTSINHKIFSCYLFFILNFIEILLNEKYPIPKIYYNI